MDSRERYPKLPPRRDWPTAEEEYIDQLPEALRGVLRQFTTAVLDVLGGAVHPNQFNHLRRTVFDHRDRLSTELQAWLELCALVDEHGTLTVRVRTAMKEELIERRRDASRRTG